MSSRHPKDQKRTSAKCDKGSFNPLTPTVATWVQLLTLSHERQSARMSQIINDGLTRSGTGCFRPIAVPVYPYGNNERQRVKSRLWN